MQKSQRFTVSGRVQGVFFRASTRAKAKELALSGWVRNLPDGRVEGIASGEAQQLAEFSQWLQQGPELAKVAELILDECDEIATGDFEIR